jgi:hypothetical protein
MNPGFLTRRGLRAGAVLLGGASVLGCPARAEVSPPIKLALFDFELEDFSAAGALPGSTDPKHLALVTDEARRLVAQSQRYSLVETSGLEAPAAKEHWLRKCDGCEAAIAAKLGADQALVGVVTRLSRTEYTVQFQIRDARTGHIVSRQRTDLRMGADYSWNRGTRWLIENRLLASDIRR